MIKLLLQILLDEQGGTLSMTRKTANTLATAAGINLNMDECEAVVNALEADNLSADCVTAAKLNSDVVRSGYGLMQHTDGTLYVDVSDTTPGLEITDGGLRAKVDDTTIERASGGIQVKQAGLDHGSIGGLTDDDHTDYLNTTRHDTTTRHPLTVGGTGANSAAGAFTNIVVPKVYDSGWFAVTTSTTYSKTHSLGTTKVIYKLLVGTASDGSGEVFSPEANYGWETGASGTQYQGCQVCKLSTTEVKIRTSSEGLYSCYDENGTLQTRASGYARIIMLALE